MDKRVSLVISQLTNPDPTERTSLALSIARQAFQQWPTLAHYDELLVAYLIAQLPFMPDCIGMKTSQGYTKFVMFVCDVWQLLIYDMAS